MFKIIGIVASIILGAFLGRITFFLMTKKGVEVHPTICYVTGVIGGALGSWLIGAFFGNAVRAMLLQMAVGIGFSVLMLLFLVLIIPKRTDDDFDDIDDDDEE